MNVRRNKTKPRMNVQVRWLITRDMPEVLRIEELSFENPWVNEDFLTCLRKQNCIGMVAENENKIVAFMVYELHLRRLIILRWAVHPDARRMGVGSAMALRLKDKLGQQRRSQVDVTIPETWLDAQLFLSAMGFRAAPMRSAFEDCDGMFFRYIAPREAPEIEMIGR